LAGAPPRTSLGELTALPRPPSWFKGALLLRDGREEENVRERKGQMRGREGEGKEGDGKEEEGSEVK